MKVIVANPLRQNRMLAAAEAFELGFADRLLEPAEFVDESLAFAAELVQNSTETVPKLPARVRPSPPADSDTVAEIVRKARARVDSSVHGAAPAPYRALDLIEGACSGWTVDEGYRAEEEAVGELLPGPQAQASLYAFDLVERRAKRRPELLRAPKHEVTKVGIVGAGLMARQLATLFVRRLEVPVVLRDLEHKAVEGALADVGGEIDALVAKGRYDEGKGRFLKSLVGGSTSYDGFADADLVLEAVFEELEVKKQVFAELEDVVPEECVLATNTSALSVTEAASDLRAPQRTARLCFPRCLEGGRSLRHLRPGLPGGTPDGLREHGEAERMAATQCRGGAPRRAGSVRQRAVSPVSPRTHSARRDRRTRPARRCAGREPGGRGRPGRCGLRRLHFRLNRQAERHSR